MSALYILKLLGQGVFSLWLLWVFFLAVMQLRDARDRGALTVWGLRLGYTVLIPGWVLDFIVQVTIANVIFFPSLPRELTVSARVNRLIATSDGWPRRCAGWFRDHLLKPFDPSGGHG